MDPDERAHLDLQCFQIQVIVVFGALRLKMFRYFLMLNLTELGLNSLKTVGLVFFFNKLCC